MVDSSLSKGRKCCGKRRNCSLRAISPFSTEFSIDLFCRHKGMVWERVNPLCYTQLRDYVYMRSLEKVKKEMLSHNSNTHVDFEKKLYVTKTGCNELKQIPLTAVYPLVALFTLTRNCRRVIKCRHGGKDLCEINYFSACGRFTNRRHAGGIDIRLTLQSVFHPQFTN